MLELIAVPFKCNIARIFLQELFGERSSLLYASYKRYSLDDQTFSYHETYHQHLILPEQIQAEDHHPCCVPHQLLYPDERELRYLRELDHFWHGGLPQLEDRLVLEIKSNVMEHQNI